MYPSSTILLHVNNQKQKTKLLKNILSNCFLTPVQPELCNEVLKIYTKQFNEIVYKNLDYKLQFYNRSVILEIKNMNKVQNKGHNIIASLYIS